MSAETMTITDAIDNLEHLRDKYGDVQVVLWDMDTGSYFPLWGRCFEAQKMDDGSIRISIGIEGNYADDWLPGPKERPL